MISFWLSFQQGPPDLEEVIKKFLRKFSGKNSKLDAFRNDNGPANGGGSGGSSRNLNFNILPILALILFVIVGIVMLSGFYTVDQSERAVTFRFGKPIGVSQPGLRWILPFIEDKQIVNLTGVRTVEVGYRGNQSSKIARESLMLTDNLNIIDLQFAVQYLLKDPEDYLYNNRDPDSAVLQVAETAMREIVGRSNIDFVLYEGREEIALATQSLMQDILDRYRTGISVQQVAIQNVQPPDQVQDAFEDAIRARQDLERKINEGEAYYNDVVPKAQGLSSRILEDAQAYREQKIAIAEGASQRFINLATEYDAAPEVTRQRLYLDTLEDVMKRTNKIIVDQQEGSNSLIYLPLDQLIRNSQSKLSSEASSILNDILPSGSSNNNTVGQNWSDSIRDDIRRSIENRTTTNN